jgi:hypothetical protein
MSIKINWSARRVPAMGEKFTSRVEYCGVWGDPPTCPAGIELEVVGFAVEHGWLYVFGRPTEAKWRAALRRWCKKRGNPIIRDYTYVAGIDVPQWEPSPASEEK